MFKLAELKRIDHGFYHPSTDKLLNLIRRTNPENATPQTKMLLEQISKQRKNCQNHAPRPLTFSATIPDSIIFNRTVILDLKWVIGKPLLHVVDAETHYSAEKFLNGESTKDAGESLLDCWVSVYIGFPDIIKTDHGSLFKSKDWNKMPTAKFMAVEIAPINFSNSIGAGERYQDPLRIIFLKIMRAHPGAGKDLTLSMANKAINHTCGTEGLLPIFLVYGVTPRLPGAASDLQDQETRMNMM